VAAGCSWLAALGIVADAQAYCRTTTCDPAADCEYDLQGCPMVGAPLFWQASCVSYSVQRDGSPARNIDYDEVHAIAGNSFASWMNSDCMGEEPSLSSLDLGPANCTEPAYNSHDPNANLITFRDHDWPYSGAGAALALTTVTFNTETGEIFDADIEVNSFKRQLTTSDTDVEYDLESILTHEVGHFLGLSHSKVEGATMVEEYDGGHLLLRDLSDDDEAGMCAAYPPRRSMSTNDCRPRHGFSPDCSQPPDDGCAVAATPSGSSPTWPLVVLLFIGARTRARARIHTRRSGADPD